VVINIPARAINAVIHPADPLSLTFAVSVIVIPFLPYPPARLVVFQLHALLAITVAFQYFLTSNTAFHFAKPLSFNRYNNLTLRINSVISMLRNNWLTSLYVYRDFILCL
jgi:hypothetical protein